MSCSNIDSNYDDDEDRNDSSSDEDGLKADKKYQLGDFFFGETEVDPLSADHDQCDCMGLQMDSKTVEEDNEWEVPAESIYLRHEITHQPIVNDPYTPDLAPLPNKLSNNQYIPDNYLVLTTNFAVL